MGSWPSTARSTSAGSRSRRRPRRSKCRRAAAVDVTRRSCAGAARYDRTGFVQRIRTPGSIVRRRTATSTTRTSRSTTWPTEREFQNVEKLRLNVLYAGSTEGAHRAGRSCLERRLLARHGRGGADVPRLGLRAARHPPRRRRSRARRHDASGVHARSLALTAAPPGDLAPAQPIPALTPASLIGHPSTHEGTLRRSVSCTDHAPPLAVTTGGGPCGYGQGGEAASTPDAGGGGPRGARSALRSSRHRRWCPGRRWRRAQRARPGLRRQVWHPRHRAPSPPHLRALMYRVDVNTAWV